MKNRYLPLLAGLLTIGSLGAYGSTAAAATEDPISNANAAQICLIAEIDDIQAHTNIGGIANHINHLSISKSKISSISRLAIGNLNANILDEQIDAERTTIAA
jgi:hypothetical protein